MQILIIILCILILIVVLFYWRASKLPDFYMVSESIDINASPEKISDAIADFNIYKQWNVWSNSDPTVEIKIEGTPNNIGHKWYWSGKKTGIGTLEVKKIQRGKRIDMNLEFVKPMQSVADDWWELEPNSQGGTTVKWSNTGKFNKLAHRIMGPMISKSLSKQFKEGLQNFKNHIEQ